MMLNAGGVLEIGSCATMRLYVPSLVESDGARNTDVARLVEVQMDDFSRFVVSAGQLLKRRRYLQPSRAPWLGGPSNWIQELTNRCTIPADSRLHLFWGMVDRHIEKTRRIAPWIDLLGWI